MAGTPPPRRDTLVDRFITAAAHHPDVHRAFIDTVLCLALPQDVVNRPGLGEKIARLGTLDRPSVPARAGERLLQLLTA
jgi:hypothetical protein